MSDTIYMIHPNNKLTKLDKYAIPNMESYIKILKTQIKRITKSINQSQIGAGINNDHNDDNNSKINNTIKSSSQIITTQEKLLLYKQTELFYISSNLKILKLLQKIDECCCSNGVYDYDHEDEILDEIQIEMNNFHKAEEQLKNLKKEINNNKNNDPIINDRNEEALGNFSKEQDQDGLTNMKSLEDSTRRESIVKIEDDHVENVETESIY